MRDCLNALSSSILGFYPNKSTLEILSEKEWGIFSEEHNLPNGISGNYIPHEQKAYVLYGEENELIKRASHEYIGHANFCEHNIIGKKIVDLNKEIFSLEEELFGSKFPKNKKIRLAVGKEKGIIENEDILIIIPEYEKERIMFYSKIRTSSEQFFQQNYELYEGFALWIESKIGERISPSRIGYQGFLQIKKIESESNFLLQIGFMPIKQEVNAGWQH